MVDPITGKPSDAEDAISRYTFKNRQRVDPETGKRSNDVNAIPKSTYYYLKKKN